MKQQDRIDRAHYYLRTFVQITLVVALFIEAYNARWVLFSVTALALILIQVPLLFEKKYDVHFPPEFQIFMVIFIYASVFLGEVHGFYVKFWWWDSVLHFGSGIVLGIIGFGMMYLLHKTGRIIAKPIFIAFIALCFAIAMGAIWEIYEFAMDTLLGTNMQRLETGVFDTMVDLIIDSIGAFIASIAGYFYLRKGDNFLLSRLLRKFVERNPRLFD